MKILNVVLAAVLVMGLGLGATVRMSAEDNVINVPGDYPTIQQAIDAASDGDTVVVAARLYKENIVIDKSLTLKGEQAGVDARTRSGPETIIEAGDDVIGIDILTADGRVVVIDGLTVRNAFHAVSTSEAGVMAAHIVVRNLRVLDTADFGISLTFTERATVEYCYVEDAQIGINAGALVPYPATVATLRHNEMVNVRFGFTGYLKDSLIERNLVRCTVTDKNVIEGTGISGQFFDTQVKNNTVSGYADGAAMSFAWHYGRGISENVKVEGNTFTKNRRGIHVFSDQTELRGIAVNFNNILDNSGRGVHNDGGQGLDARRNWWGRGSGPYHFTENRDGKGNSVSARVDFGPWLRSPVAVVKTQTVNGDGLVDAKDEADTEVEITGAAAVIVARYAANPGDDPMCLTSLGKYVDVYVADATGVDEAEIRLYYTEAELAAAKVSEESLRLFWWDGEGWVQCSHSEARTDETDGYSGYVLARIMGDTMPSLAELTGTPFAVYELPPPVPFVATVGLPAGQAGSAYEATLEACGGSGPYFWAIVEGTLPIGLELVTGSGVIRGTPTEAGRFDFTVSVTDAAQVSATVELSITVNPDRALPCFIATAAYGSGVANQVEVLREFRDTVLLSSKAGCRLVSLYYRTSPPLADYVSRYEGLRAAVRVGFIGPMVVALTWSQGLWSREG